MRNIALSLVTAEWLGSRLGTVVVVDATYAMPPNAEADLFAFRSAHILGARHFPVDSVVAEGSDLPHMLPSPERFAEAVGALGIARDDHVVVYDRSVSHFSAPRVWWTFKCFSHQNVSVLDGGLNAWRAVGGRETSRDAQIIPRRYPVPRLDEQRLATFAQVQETVRLKRPGTILLDARPANRFFGDAPEPRPNLRSGHMPGALNIPSTVWTGSDGRFLARDEIERVLAYNGIGPTDHVITTCGSGMTACIAALAVESAGWGPVSVYDGSWTEWASTPDAVIETGKPISQR